MNTWHKLHGATLELVTGYPIKQRVSLAYSKYLCDVHVEDLPEELREAFTALCAALISVRPLPGETAVQATVRKMSGEQIDRCAAEIVRLFGALGRAQPGMNGLARAPRDTSDTVVPLFAAEA